MKQSVSSARRRAFTLIELLAVIAIIGILITLVSPQIGKARLRGKLVESAAKARYIVEAIVAKETGSRFAGSAWPTSDGPVTNQTSTAFLDALVQGGYLDVDYSWFAGPGMKPARDRAEFLADGPAHNAWCIVANINDATPGNFPAVFSKNLRISGHALSFDAKALPYGDKGFAFATKNGEARSVEKDDMVPGTIEHIFTIGDANVGVLEP